MRYRIRPYSLLWWLKYVGQAVALLLGLLIVAGAVVILGGVL